MRLTADNFGNGYISAWCSTCKLKSRLGRELRVNDANPMIALEQIEEHLLQHKGHQVEITIDGTWRCHGT